jgi:hypothetical protein
MESQNYGIGQKLLAKGRGPTIEAYMKGKIRRTQWCDSIEIQLAMHTPLVSLLWLHFPTLEFHGVQCMRMYAAYLDGCFFIASSHKIGNVA